MRRAARPTSPRALPPKPCQRKHGLTVVVENKTGAGGFIALKSVPQAPPDGYTVGIGIMGQLAVGPVVPGANIPLDLDKELVPVANLVGVPMALIVRMDAPFKTIPELVAYAKANPGKVTYASTGLGSTNQLAAEFLAAEFGRAEADPCAVSRRRAGDRRRGGGQTSTSSSATSPRSSAWCAAARCARWRSPRPSPSPLAPELPLLTKDIPALDINNWFGLVGPAALPADIKDALARLFLEAMAIRQQGGARQAGARGDGAGTGRFRSVHPEGSRALGEGGESRQYQSE